MPKPPSALSTVQPGGPPSHLPPCCLPAVLQRLPVALRCAVSPISFQNGSDMIQSQLLCLSFKLMISFTFSTLIIKILDSEQLDKLLVVLVGF